ncbi:hypothetical protein C8Q72DRAFT_455774 [Fomitopsis betulina]|nr:hypothetical protein C8Q72DRAFT_455774 [Fomitopsis betulina]
MDGSTPVQWTFGSSDLRDIDLDVLAACAPQIAYIRRLTSSWGKLTAPSSWLEPTSVEQNGYLTCQIDWQYMRAMLLVIQDSLAIRTLDDIFYDIQNNTGELRNGRGSIIDMQTGTTLNQVAQILHYRSHPLIAEHAIASMFDGIKGVYIRKQQMYTHSGEPVPETILFAALYPFVPPTSPLSLKVYSRRPISPSNPALLLCAMGPDTWKSQFVGAGETREHSMTTILHDLARTAAPNLDSLMEAFRRQQQCVCQYDKNPTSERDYVMAQPEVVLPDWALTIGLIYDSEKIRCVAHIPYLPPGGEGPHYLSFHFATLPFPSDCPGSHDAKKFVEGRYRVTVALLSLQEHVARLAKLYEEVFWTARDQPYSQEPSTALAPQAKWSLTLRGLPCASPTISEIALDVDKHKPMDLASRVSRAYGELMYDGLASSGSCGIDGPDAELVRRVCEWYDVCATQGCEGCNLPTDSVLGLDSIDCLALREDGDHGPEDGEHDQDQLEDNQIDNDHMDCREDAQVESDDESPEALTDNDSEDLDPEVSVLRLWRQWKAHVLDELQPDLCPAPCPDSNADIQGVVSPNWRQRPTSLRYASSFDGVASESTSASDASKDGRASAFSSRLKTSASSPTLSTGYLTSLRHVSWEETSDTVELLLLRSLGDPYNKFLQRFYCNISGSCITAIEYVAESFAKSDTWKSYSLDGWAVIVRRLKEAMKRWHIPEGGNATIAPILVPPAYMQGYGSLRDGPNDIANMDMTVTVLTLQWLNAVYQHWAPQRAPWLRTPDMETPKDEALVPRVCLYTRDDASIDQKTSLLVLFRPYTASTQFVGELPADGILEYFISRILGGPSPFWTSLSLVNSTQQEDTSREHLPLFVSVRGYACEQNTSGLRLAIETARIHMARVLQRTIDSFIKRHYAEQHWEPDRKLTASDVKVPMDPNFYTYGMFYNNCTFRMFASFPVLSRDANGRYRGMVRNIELQAFDYVQPMVNRQRGLVLSFMLTAEQHIHNLKEILGYL